MNHSVRRAARAFSLIALALCLVAPVAAQARSGPAAASPELDLSIGTRCVNGSGFVKGDSVRLTQQRGAKTLTDVSFKTTASSFDRCLATPVAVGDKVRFVRKVGTQVKQQRTITVPDLRITGDLEANTLTVDVFVNGAPLTTYVGLGATNFIAGTDTHGLNTAAVLDENGHSVSYMVDYSWTLMPGDVTYTAWDTPAGDTVYRWWAPPTMTVQAGKAAVSGVGRAGGKATLTLKAAGGAVRSSVTAKIGSGVVSPMDAVDSSAWYATSFTSNGAPVAVKPGNRITSSAMDSTGRTVLPNDFQATAGTGDGTVTGTCHPDSTVAISRGPYAEWTFDTPSGAISRSDLGFASGEKMIIACQTPDGYGQRFIITVP